MKEIQKCNYFSIKDSAIHLGKGRIATYQLNDTFMHSRVVSCVHLSCQRLFYFILFFSIYKMNRPLIESNDNHISKHVTKWHKLFPCDTYLSRAIAHKFSIEAVQHSTSAVSHILQVTEPKIHLSVTR